MSITNTYGNTTLNWLIRDRNTWVALHDSDPLVTGEPSTEITGGPDSGYERQAGSWGAAASRQIANNTVLVFTNLPAAIITYAAVWDASAFGTCIASGAFATPKTTSDGDMLIIAASELVISL